MERHSCHFREQESVVVLPSRCRFFLSLWALIDGLKSERRRGKAGRILGHLLQRLGFGFPVHRRVNFDRVSKNIVLAGPCDFFF